MNAIAALTVKTGITVNAVKAGVAGWVFGADLNPTPQAPPGVEGNVQTLLNWLMWGGLVAAIAGFISAAIMLAVSNERGMGNEHVKRLGLVCLACVIISAASGVAKVLVG
jgi:hypothetical protein